jgi:nucleoside-diphosphate-sugar epimerase
MDVLVTGAAGFIGSHVADRLLADGHRVRGVDALTDNYPVGQKRANLAPADASGAFTLAEGDLATMPTVSLTELLEGVDAVVHLAARPGVRKSFTHGFAPYASDNVVATQRLLEAVAATGGGPRFMYGSSSSVYGVSARLPTTESDPLKPHSPYAVTKLAGEHLCGVYAANKAISTVVLRFFTVYGPRQRPDMGLHRFIEHALDGEPVPVFGTGEQVRDYTYVGDVVDAIVRATLGGIDAGSIFNVAGGSAASVNGLLGLLGEAIGRPVAVERLTAQPGDVPVTWGATERLRDVTGWEPRTHLRRGLERQLAWHRQRRHG